MKKYLLILAWAAVATNCFGSSVEIVSLSEYPKYKKDVLALLDENKDCFDFSFTPKVLDAYLNDHPDEVFVGHVGGKCVGTYSYGAGKFLVVKKSEQKKGYGAQLAKHGKKMMKKKNKKVVQATYNNAGAAALLKKEGGRVLAKVKESGFTKVMTKIK